MSEFSEIAYCDFYDVPRLFVVHHENRLYAFDCSFSNDLDEYPKDYQVYEVEQMPLDDARRRFQHWNEWTRRLIGRVSVRDVQFDETKRRMINAEILNQFDLPKTI